MASLAHEKGQEVCRKVMGEKRVQFRSMTVGSALPAAEISPDCGLIRGRAAARSTRTAEFMRGELLELSRRVSTTPTVLVVDDEPLVRWSVCETLAGSGYAVTQAGDALQALTAVKATGADVVLLDTRLPDSAGLGVVSVIRRLSPATKIILMTSFGSDALNNEARSRGAFGVLDKPFDMSALPALVAKALAA